MRIQVIAALVLSLPLPFTALADHPTISVQGGAAGPITTVSAVTPREGSFGFSLQSQIIFNDEISDHDLRRFSLLDEGVHSSDSLYSLGANAFFAASDNITLGFSLPYIWRTKLREAGHGEAGHSEDDGHGDEEAGTVEHLGDSDGIGDLTLYGKFRFFHDDLADRHAAFIAGIKTPTGRTGVRTLEGELFETEHQPGSGSWDPQAGLAFTQHLGRWSFDANVLYTFATEGAQDTDLGDVFNYNLAASYRVLGAHEHGQASGPDHHGAKAGMYPPRHDDRLAWDLLFEANGDWRDEANIGGVSDHNTGGNLLYLSAGTRVSWGDGWAASSMAGVPIVENLNGVQSEPMARLLIGISKAF